jgi:hypothetical protein
MLPQIEQSRYELLIRKEIWSNQLSSGWKKIRKPKSHTIDTLGICPKMIDI